MSKELGQKIAIKFTQDLVGDVEGNESAFTVAGEEYGYVNGPLVDKVYQIANISRYPVKRLWSIDDSIRLDHVDDGISYGIIESEIASSSGTANYELAWEFRVGNENIIVDGLRINPKTSEVRTVRLRDSSGAVLRSVDIDCVAEDWAEEDISPITLTSNTNYIISAGFVGGNYRTGKISTTTMNPKIEYVQSKWIGTVGGNPTNNVAETIYGVLDIRIKGETVYEITKIYVTSLISISGNYRMSWIGDMPEGTAFVVEITTGETQEQWQEVSNGDVITIDQNFRIRVTLSTTDTKVTPVLADLWLEEPDAPKDTLLLTTQSLSRFNNVEGNLIVSYNATKGNLAGSGGPVASFVEQFIPDELLKKPNPNDEENIEITDISASGNLVRVYYTDAKSQDERIEIADISASGILTHINDL